MIEIDMVDIFAGGFFLVLFYFFMFNLIYNLILTKRRGGEYLKKLKFLALLASYGGAFFVMMYFRVVSFPLCFLFVIGFFIILIISLYYRKDFREDFPNNLAMVIDEMKSAESFEIRDFIVPDRTFTAKTVLKYGPKKTARFFFVVVTPLILSYFCFCYYFDIITGSFLIFYLPILLIFGLYSYKKSIKDYKKAFQKAEEGSYKEDYELFDD